jgi:hypothetical protein
MRSRSIFPLLVVVFSLVAVVANAQWQPSGVPLCTAANDQISPTMIPDGSGGAILTWFDYRANGIAGDIYAQRVNSLGVPQWTANGVAICTAVDHQAAPVIVPDATTGAIIAWYDTRNGVDTDIYAQRINASGVALWAANGVALSTAIANQLFCDATSDGAGGAIVVWEDHRVSGGVGDIYAQRVNASGVPQWLANGLGVCTAGGDQLDPHVVTDGAGGAILVWRDLRAPANVDVYAQRVNAAGVAQWAANGVPVCGALGDQYFARLVADGSNGAIVGWQDDRNGPDSDIYAQRVNGSGVPQWALDGVRVCNAANSQYFDSLVLDGAGGAILTWDDGRNGIDSDIYAQRVGAAGTIQWQLDGVAISAAASYQSNSLITGDGAGGAVIAWRDTRSLTGTDLYAQRVNAFGLVQWTSDGARITVPPAQPSVGSIVWDGSAAIVASFDYRGGPGDIYAQRVEGHFGYWGHPEPIITSVADIQKDQGGYVAVNWTASQRDVYNPRTIGHYSIWRAVTALPLNSSAALLQDIASVGPGTKGPVYAAASPATDYYWELVGTQDAHGWGGYSFAAPTRADSVAGNTATERFMVAAHDNSDDYVAFQSNAGTGHSVDNLAPATPLLLTIAQAGTSALLSWKPVDAPDLAHYKVYRTAGSGTTPVPGNFLVDEVPTNYIDFGAAAAGYHYVVTAVDGHGNQSGPSNEVSLAGSTGTGGEVPPLTVVVDGNAPNPFRATSVVRVGLPHDGNVRVTIYDVGGRRVRDARMTGVKGWQTLTLDGRDDAGRELASGVYFYRVTAQGTTVTRKMVIAR